LHGYNDADGAHIQIRRIFDWMNNSNSFSNSTSPRMTLKLKVGARKSTREQQAPALPKPDSKANLKPGARWSDAYKERMQADMDSLVPR
jgi:hypothetical protein